jgi:hypothetical protein
MHAVWFPRAPPLPTAWARVWQSCTAAIITPWQVTAPAAELFRSQLSLIFAAPWPAVAVAAAAAAAPISTAATPTLAPFHVATCFILLAGLSSGAVTVSPAGGPCSCFHHILDLPRCGCICSSNAAVRPHVQGASQSPNCLSCGRQQPAMDEHKQSYE